MKIREGSATDRIRDLILTGELLEESMTSQSISKKFYEVTGKRIPSNSIIPYMQPFQEQGIVRRRMVEGKIQWYGAWESSHKTKMDSLYDQIILHPSIRSASRALFMDGHYSSAIFEACKSVNNMVKSKSKLEADGQDLMAKAFREDNPILKLNRLKTKSDIDEQSGFRFIMMGTMVGVRNPKAHDIVVQRDPVRALQYLALCDLLAARVDESKR